MKRLAIIIMLVITTFSYSETLTAQLKIKGATKRVDVNYIEFGLKCKYSTKVIKRIKYYDENKVLIKDDDTMYLIDKQNITYIQPPENAVRMKLYFDNGRNNTLYFYKR